MSISIKENKVKKMVYSDFIEECEFYEKGKTMIHYLYGNFVSEGDSLLYTGDVQEYYKDGKKKFIGQYKDGKMWRGAFFDEKGKLKTIRHGNFFIPNKESQAEGEEYDFYNRLIFEGKYEILEKNNKKYEEYRNGLLKIYDKRTGALSEEFKGEFKNGRKFIGIEKVFDKESGKVVHEFLVKYDEHSEGKRNGTFLVLRGEEVNGNIKLVNNNILIFTDKKKNFICSCFPGEEHDLRSNSLVFEGDYKEDNDGNYYRLHGKEYHNGKCKFEGSYKKGIRSEGTEFYISGNPEFIGVYDKDDGKRLKGIIYHYKEGKVAFEGVFSPEVTGKEYNKEGKLVYEGTYYEYKKRKKGTIYDGKTIEYGKEYEEKDLQKAVVEKNVEYLKNGNIWICSKDDGIGKELDVNKNIVFVGKIKAGEYSEGVLYDVKSDNPKNISFNGKFYKINKDGQEIEVREGYFFENSVLSFSGKKEPLENGLSKPTDGISYHQIGDLCKKILFINCYEMKSIKSSGGKKIYEKSMTNPENIELKQNNVYNVELYLRNLLDTTDVYNGQFLNNNFHGKGILCRYNGENYDFFKDFKQDEKNLLYKYDGGFFHGVRSGYGMEYDGGKIYKGEFKAGLKHGEGVLSNGKTKVKLKGTFRDDEPYKIEEYDNNKLVFDGIYKNYKRWEGKGKEYNGKTKIFDGEYKDGFRWNGIGKEYDKEGNLLFEGTYKDGLRFGSLLIKSMPAKINLNTITYKKIEIKSMPAKISLDAIEYEKVEKYFKKK